ncbi:MAG: glutamine synthetase family protein, partial [Solirubrobacteraceae bacterium]
FEIPVAAAEGLAGADRAVVLREVVREVARRHGLRASFAPLLDPAGPGNGVHVHLHLLDAAGAPLLYDASRPACLSELGGHFAAGILRHAGALSALCAPSPVSSARLTPHRWSAGAVCLGERNRETLLRIPPLVALAAAPLAAQLRLEYRGADATANPYLALGALVHAGLEGVRAGLPAPPVLDRDPAQLDAAEAERYGVGALPGSLEESLRALAEDGPARAWLGPTLYEAYVGVKRAELDAVAGLDLSEVCRRYAALY